MTKYLTLIGIMLLLMISCKPKDEQTEVIIKGKIKTNVLGQEGKDSLSLADATQILVFKGIDETGGGLDYSLVDIIDGSFQASAKMGSAAALIFLDANYKYIGNLSNQGLNLLPLGVLSDGENTTIDLETLTMIGSSIIPSHDPFGNEIIISAEQIETLKELDSFFESLAKNIDPDNNGRPEILDDKKIFLMTSFDTYAGHYGIDNTAFVINDSLNEFVNYFFNISCWGGLPFPQTATLSGPMDSAYTDISELHHWGDDRSWGLSYTRNTTNYGSPHAQSYMPFKKGIYTLDLDGKLYTFDFSCIMKKNKMVLAAPTLHLNSEGKIVSFSLDYRLPDNTSIEPENILTHVGIQLTATDSSGMQHIQIYTSPVMYAYKPEGWTNNIADGYFYEQLGIYSHTPLQPIDISNYTNLKVAVAYYDMLGNQYSIIWD